MDEHNLYKDFQDIIVNAKFQEQFYSKFPNSPLDFYCGSLQHSLKLVVETRKPLLFFLHKEEDKYSQECCNLLDTEAIKKFLCDHYLIMGWDIYQANENVCQGLSEQICMIDEVIPYVRNNIPCIFIVIPNAETVKVASSLDVNQENMTEAFLLSILKKDQLFVARYITREYFKNMTSYKYQQWIYDELGDRDYDSFESDEEKLLKEKILFAIYGPPQELYKGKEFNYKDKQVTTMEQIYEKIRLQNNEFSKWDDRIVIAFIYNCIEPTAEEKQKKIASNPADYKPEEDFCPVPVFVLRKCKFDETDTRTNIKPCRVFIDGDCRVYKDWEKYLENNCLPQCKMVYPEDGRYKGNDKDLCLKEQQSPSCSLGATAKKFGDYASSIGGFLSGAALIASTVTPLAAVTVPAALIVGTASGAYGASRGVGTLVDRGTHEQSISIKNSESRGAYFTIGAGVLSACAAGATKLVSQTVGRGLTVGTSIEHALTIISGSSILISGAATVNSVYEVVQQYIDEDQLPSALTVAQLGSSLFFFGNSVVNFRTGATLVREIQTNTLNEMSDALRSNRQRKTFNKLIKETIRQQGEVKGRAEVISTMRSAVSKDDMIAVLSRSNKYFNKNRIKFSAANGGISLNGVPLDIIDFGNLPKTQQGVVFETLPPIPENHTTSGTLRTVKIVERIQGNQFPGGVLALEIGKIVTALTDFKEDVQEKIIKIINIFMKCIDVDIISSLRELLNGNIHTQIMEYIINFIRKQAGTIKTQFNSQILERNVQAVCQQFGFRNPNVTIHNFIDIVVNRLISETSEYMDQLKSDFHNWHANLEYENEVKIKRKTERHNHSIKTKVDCSVCGGYYYVSKEK